MFKPRTAAPGGWVLSLLTAGLLILAGPAAAGSRIVGTGGVSPIEGGGGGGLSPWAVITGYASAGEWDATGFATRVHTDDFRLTSTGFALGMNDRVEVSWARQRLDVQPLDLALRQDVFGAKLRVAGELLYSTMPQISLGAQHKRHRDFAVPELLGARDDSGTDMYLSAAKLFFAAVFDRNLFLNVTTRYTRANETGLLGFGGPDEGRRLMVEGSAALFLTDRWVLGYEYRQKPQHLSSVDEHSWQDIFVGYFPGKRVSLVGAYVQLEEIAGLQDQNGFYLSLQTRL